MSLFKITANKLHLHLHISIYLFIYSDKYLIQDTVYYVNALKFV